MNLELNLDENKNKNNVFDDVEIVVDPDLEDESTVNINNYINKYILQCRICGNLFPSDTILDNEDECPICNSTSSNGFIYKGKLINKKKQNDLSDEEKDAIDSINNEQQNNISEDETY